MSQDRSERVQCGQANNVQDRIDEASGDRAALQVLRGIWAARGHSAAELGDGWVGNAKACKNSAALGLPEVDDGLRAAWRARLAREGKLVPGATGVAGLAVGDAALRLGGPGVGGPVRAERPGE